MTKGELKLLLPDGFSDDIRIVDKDGKDLTFSVTYLFLPSNAGEAVLRLEVVE